MPVLCLGVLIRTSHTNGVAVYSPTKLLSNMSRTSCVMRFPSELRPVENVARQMVGLRDPVKVSD